MAQYEIAQAWDEDTEERRVLFRGVIGVKQALRQ